MRTVRITLAAGMALGLLSLTAPAWGHAAYKSSEPPNGGRVSSPPSRITAEFTEPLAGGSYLRVTDPCGDQVDNGDVAISGFNMSVTMDGSASGRYVVFFQAHSQLDPHVTRGEFDFTASSGPPCASAASGAEEKSGSDDSSGSQGGSNGSDAAAEPASERADDRSSAPRNDSAEGSGRGSRSASRPDDRRPGELGARVPNFAAAPRDEPEKKPIWDGIELEPFLTGLLLAAIIGAAGGKIYAGIMGPRA